MIQSETFYETLLQLPIFQGLGTRDITDIVSKVKMDFRKIPAGKTFISEDTPCSKMTFIIKGEYSVTHYASNRRIRFVEHPKTPEVIGVNSLFGLRQYHTHTCEAISEVQIMTIDKIYVIQNLMQFEVCRINYLNLLSTSLHRAQQNLSEKPNLNLIKRFIQTVKNNSILPVGEKHIYASMIDLADHLGATRLHLSAMLNQLETQGHIVMARRHIAIPALQNLIRYGQEL